MDPANFVSPQFGTARREPGNKFAFWYFHPAPMPRELALSADTVLSLSDADAALGHLQGLGHLVRDPELLLGPYLTREAVASSRIEGTRASLSDVLKAEASATASSEDVKEVERYVSATRSGLAMLDELPIAQRLVQEVHRVLMEDVRGQERLPGEFRRSPVWVGSASDRPETAAYVPPHHDLIGDLFADWERFVNEPCSLPVLIRCALMHYQFETIHPFLDGNGRIGRLLVGLMLVQEKRLSTPLLYLSGYLERHRRDYYERLQGVRERGEIQEWLQFFLTAVKRQAEDAVGKSSKLVALRERYNAEAASARSRVGGLVDLMFANPFLTVTRVERSLGVTNQGARNLLRDAAGRGWLFQLEVRADGRGRRRYWVAHEIWQVSEGWPP